MKVTRRFLANHNACKSSLDFAQTEGYKYNLDHKQVVKGLLAHDKLNWAIWLMSECMNKKQSLLFMVYVLKQIASTCKSEPFEGYKTFMIAVQNYLKNPSEKNKFHVQSLYKELDPASDLFKETVRYEGRELGLRLLNCKLYGRKYCTIQMACWIRNVIICAYGSNHRIVVRVSFDWCISNMYVRREKLFGYCFRLIAQGENKSRKH